MTKHSREHAILVIDDDDRMRDSLQKVLVRRGYSVTLAADGRRGLEQFENARFDVILCDLRMPEMDGLEVCSKLRELGCTVPTIMITAHGSVESAVQAMQEGAFNYLTKPFKTDELLVVVEKAISQARLIEENRLLRSEIGLRGAFGNMVGASAAMLKVHELIERYASSDATVLIRGESGTGKELVARAIHDNSPRKDRPFVCVNCAALSAGVLESELFGHERGAFTGAEQKRLGRFEIAEGGTLLLDEVSEIDPRLQAKLMRVLQEKTFERVGSSDSIQADVRVLATSNRELEHEVEKGGFREDLFFRLNVLPVPMPPLRDRREDVPTLMAHFLANNQKRCGGDPKEFSAEAEVRLRSYDWPGNVRELENVIERGWVLTDGPVIDEDSLSSIVPGRVQPLARVTVAGTQEVLSGGVPFSGMPLKAVEKILIKAALQRHGGHQKRTAAELGIGVRTLRSKIKQWNLGNDGVYDDDDVDDSDLVVVGSEHTEMVKENA
jgi:DNA-binding NtrC family response regulator